MEQLQHLLNKVNKVTAYHRHGNKIPKSALDELSNAQIEYEKSFPVDKPVGVPSRTNSETLLECNMENKYSIEPHGDGYAIYYGRCMHKHGYNLAHLTECEEKFIKIIEEALNKKSVKP